MFNHMRDVKGRHNLIMWGWTKLDAHLVYHELTKWSVNFVFIHICSGVGSLVPRPRLAFCHLQYGKVGEGLVSFLT